MLPFQHMFTTYSLYVTQSSMNMRWHFVIFGTYHIPPPLEGVLFIECMITHIHSLGRSGQIYGNHLSFTRLVHVHQICPYEPSTIKLEMSWIWFMKLVLEPDSLSSNHELFFSFGERGVEGWEKCVYWPQSVPTLKWLACTSSNVWVIVSLHLNWLHGTFVVLGLTNVRSNSHF